MTGFAICNCTLERKVLKQITVECRMGQGSCNLRCSRRAGPRTRRKDADAGSADKPPACCSSSCSRTLPPLQPTSTCHSGASHVIPTRAKSEAQNASMPTTAWEHGCNVGGKAAGQGWHKFTQHGRVGTAPAKAGLEYPRSRASFLGRGLGSSTLHCCAATDRQACKQARAAMLSRAATPHPCPLRRQPRPDWRAG